MPKRETLGKVELELLNRIASRNPVSVRDLVEQLADNSGQARTTVLTVVERLRKKGFLSRRKIDGVFHYSPRVAITELLPRLVGDFVERMLGGSVSPFVAYLQDSEQISPAELQELKQLVKTLEQREQRGAP